MFGAGGRLCAVARVGSGGQHPVDGTSRVGCMSCAGALSAAQGDVLLRGPGFIHAGFTIIRRTRAFRWWPVRMGQGGFESDRVDVHCARWSRRM